MKTMKTITLKEYATDIYLSPNSLLKYARKLDLDKDEKGKYIINKKTKKQIHDYLYIAKPFHAQLLDLLNTKDEEITELSKEILWYIDKNEELIEDNKNLTLIVEAKKHLDFKYSNLLFKFNRCPNFILKIFKIKLD